MTRQAISEQLKLLAASDLKRSKSARLRELIDDIETALNAGVSRSSVVESLSANGLSMTLKTFDSAMYRIRLKRRGQATFLGRETTPAIAKSDANAEGSCIGSHDPKDLDRIFRSAPDLDALTRMHRNANKKGDF